MPFLERSDGHAIHYRLDGPGSDGVPWIVFGNSLMTDLAVWDHQVPVLADRFNILRYDQRGHGRSSVPSGPVGFDILGADLAALVTELGITRCAYVGLSMGVPTGLSASRLLGGHVFERMIFSGGLAKSAPARKFFWEERIAFAIENGMEALAQQTVHRWLQEGNVDGPAGRALREMISATPLGGFTACASALREYDLQREFDALAVPVQLMAGAEDGAMPTAMSSMSEQRDGVSLDMIAGAGHIPCMERPDLFNALLERALAEKS